MMGRTHLAAGALFTAAFAPLTSQALGLDFTYGELVVGVGIGTIAGMLPDIDHPNSLITKGVMPGRKFGAIGKALGWYLSIPPRLVGTAARAKLNHRGGTHSATFMAGWTLLAAPLYAVVTGAMAFVLSLLLGAISAVLLGPLLGVNLGFSISTVVHWLIAATPHVMPLVMVSVFWGYLSHLVTDSMTKVPVPWPWPISKKRFWLLPKGMRVTTDSMFENRVIRPVILVLAVVFFLINIGIPWGAQIANEQKAASNPPAQKQPAKQHKKKHHKHHSKN